MRLGVVLDLDGTLVDSVYHHVLAWDRALSEHGRTCHWTASTAASVSVAAGS